MELDVPSWIAGFFEAQATFFVAIKYYDNQKRMRLEPTIKISRADSSLLHMIYNFFNFNNTKPFRTFGIKRRSTQLIIKDFDDIYLILDFFKDNDYKFQSEQKNSSIKLFTLALKIVEVIGVSHTKNIPEFEEFYKIKVMINSHVKTKDEINKEIEKLKKREENCFN